MQALIGDRYGYRPFPAKIPVKEFQQFLEIGTLHKISTFLLSRWYRLDENAVNPVFQLLPITVYYPNYSSKDHILREIDRDGWWKTFLELQSTFWSLVRIAYQEGMMTKERAHTYLQSGKLFLFLLDV